jgi:chromate transporter
VADGPPCPEENGREAPVSAAGLFFSFFRLGLTAFGGPAIVAYMREMVVTRKGWMTQEEFMDGTALAQSLPGATAMQVAAYVGLRTRGVAGAILSYAAFALPAFVLMLILSALYSNSYRLPWVTALFSGLQVIVVAIVLNAAYTFGRSSLRAVADGFIATASAAALWLHVSPFYVICGAAAAGILLGVKRETRAEAMRQNPIGTALICLLATLAVSLVCLYIWSTKLATLALLMLKIDLFAFGGGFASIPLMLQEIVTVRGWLDAKTFMDGIALGQVTPGPIIITATFVGYLLYGLSGAVVATVAMFTPSFLLLLGTAPFFGRLKGSSIFAGVTHGVLTSFVGLLLYVTITFALAVPWSTFRFCLAAAAFLAMLKKIDLLYILLIGAALSVILL